MSAIQAHAITVQVVQTKLTATYVRVCQVLLALTVQLVRRLKYKHVLFSTVIYIVKYYPHFRNTGSVMRSNNVQFLKFVSRRATVLVFYCTYCNIQMYQR